ncbi:hypothetical protein CVE34_25515 [Pseudomonas syringae pv. actinidiae]|uniref:Uncharacterized protein n=2 Tax=Pseudomonas syringae group TaxID=136849 RepID=A0A261WD66_9PSED|nr:hypothetical protein JN853_04820 [Pseudomonas syringae pv. actinidiae ICMP 9853]ATV19932.1 hypothetical protein CT122_26310 [Pseudomonas syringae pv. actinidiae]AVB18715.1 hypothetical protein BKM03_05245 [Pseudomonas avellanae]POP80772.1 hypothetical protein CXB34_24905 [Pseudomonas amygdali pv. morsprunorum]NAS68522.1 hypothetical protein [Pseudomonas syringae pv. actinidiae]
MTKSEISGPGLDISFLLNHPPDSAVPAVKLASNLKPEIEKSKEMLLSSIFLNIDPSRIRLFNLQD